MIYPNTLVGHLIAWAYGARWRLGLGLVGALLVTTDAGRALLHLVVVALVLVTVATVALAAATAGRPGRRYGRRSRRSLVTVQVGGRRPAARPAAARRTR